jgi:hypothetical protein
MIITALKSYFLVVVALASIAGSVYAAPNISNLAKIAGSSSGGSLEPSSSIIQDASAQSVPFRVDHHLKIKEKVGDPVTIVENINDGEQHCEASCKYIEYKPGRAGRAGLAFIADTPADLSGAKRVHFFLMGENGGETVRVKLAGKSPQSDNANANEPRGLAQNVTPRGSSQNVTTGPPQSVADDLFKEKFALSTDVITLPNDWKRYEVPLDGVDLKNTVAPFAIELLKGKGSAPQVVYLKYIVYDTESVDQRFLLPANGTGTATIANTTAVETNNNNTEADDPINQNIGRNDSAGSSNTTAPGTIIEEEETEIEDDNDNETLPTSDTNDSAADTTTTTTTPSSGNELSNSGNTTLGPSEGIENVAPTAAVSIDNLVAHPGDRVILDGSPSRDPDGDQITYQWTQSDGPEAEIIGADTLAPAITIPALDQDDQITIDLIVSDGQAESNEASIVIDVQYLEEIEDAIQKDLPPDDNIAGQGWNEAACDSDIVACLTDNSESSFVSSDNPGVITTDMLFSFQDPSIAGINGSSSNTIAYVTAEFIAKKIGASGFTSLIVDDPDSNEHYSTPGISIASDSFDRYSFTWTNNPVTGEPWSVESLNSFIAGYRHLAGQGSIQISEFKLVIGSFVSEVEQEPLPPAPSSDIDEEPSGTEEPEPEEAIEDDNGDDDSNQGDSDDAAPEEEEEPAAVNDGNDDGEEEENDGNEAGSADLAPMEDTETDGEGGSNQDN